MARPLEFDRNAALEAAMKLFWRQGYAATSLSQLLDAMDIGRSSFYAAFTDKRSLYVEALTLFADRTRAMLDDACAADASIEAIRRFFYATLFDVPEARLRNGCLMVNTLLELADVDDDLSDLAARKLGEVQSGFEACIARAVESGQLHTDRAPRELAEFVMLVNQGLRVASRRRTNKRELKRAVDTAMSLLGAAR
jgi:TetR/AcrR family transcriptional regulator, transcriptional repressor for nem operon